MTNIVVMDCESNVGALPGNLDRYVLKQVYRIIGPYFRKTNAHGFLEHLLNSRKH